MVQIDAGERHVVADEIGQRVDAAARAALALRAVDDLPCLIVRILARADQRLRLRGTALVSADPELIDREADRCDLEQPDGVHGVLQPHRPRGGTRGGHAREHEGETHGDASEREHRDPDQHPAGHRF